MLWSKVFLNSQECKECRIVFSQDFNFSFESNTQETTVFVEAINHSLDDCNRRAAVRSTSIANGEAKRKRKDALPICILTKRECPCRYAD